MPRRSLLCLLGLLLCWWSLDTATAGAFLLPEGQGQLIAGVGYVEATRRFDQGGRTDATPAFRKTYASGYLEYGLTSTLSLVLAPSASREHDAPATNAVTGSDGSAFGARYQIYGSTTGVVAVQALVQPPIGGMRNLGADLRVMFGRAFPLFGWPAFVDIEPGMRIRADPYPNEARLDVTVGARPIPRLMILVQAFASDAPRQGALPSLAYCKLQPSLVYDLAPAWSVQFGFVRTVAGRGIVRESGPIGALWYRF